jgi:hypothetical protein
MTLLWMLRLYGFPFGGTNSSGGAISSPVATSSCRKRPSQEIA